MSARDRKQFESARQRYLDSLERQRAYGLEVLLPKYGTSTPTSTWLTRGEQRKLHVFHNQRSRASDSLFAVLERVSPRSWNHGVPHAWVMEHLSYEDATTAGQLSIVPPPGYGSTAKEMERFAAPVK